MGKKKVIKHILGNQLLYETYFFCYMTCLGNYKQSL